MAKAGSPPPSPVMRRKFPPNTTPDDGRHGRAATRSVSAGAADLAPVHVSPPTPPSGDYHEPQEMAADDVFLNKTPPKNLRHLAARNAFRSRACHSLDQGDLDYLEVNVDLWTLSFLLPPSLPPCCPPAGCVTQHALPAIQHAGLLGACSSYSTTYNGTWAQYFCTNCSIFYSFHIYNLYLYWLLYGCRVTLRECM